MSVLNKNKLLKDTEAELYEIVKRIINGLNQNKMSNTQREQAIKDMMSADEASGLYETPKRDILKTFIDRMQRLGIQIQLAGNYPWIYIDSINGVRVTETFQGNHGFTIAFLPIRNDQQMQFTDIAEIFKLIRKYVTVG